MPYTLTTAMKAMKDLNQLHIERAVKLLRDELEEIEKAIAEQDWQSSVIGRVTLGSLAGKASELSSSLQRRKTIEDVEIIAKVIEKKG